MKFIRKFRTDAADAPRVFRRDVGTIDKLERTPGGGLRVPAVVTMPGVFEYTRADGTKIREYRPPAEVGKADSIASLRDAPVTLGHPATAVTADTWRAVAIGHVSDSPQVSDAGVSSTLVVNDAAAIAKIGTDAKEVSCGYSVDLDMTPGVTPNGERYDAVQRNITYNHVALGPAGWGRQGATVALRLDSAGNEVLPGPVVDCKCGSRSDEHLPWDECMAKAMREYGDETTARKVCGSIKAKSADSKDAPPMKIKIVVDGKEHEAEAGSADHIALQARADAALAAASAKAETEKARADAAQVKIDALTKDLAEAPAKIRAESDARAKLETDARAVLGADAKFAHADGDRVVPFSTRDIHAAVLAKLEPSYKIDSAVTDPYLQARFDIAVADARKIAGGGETLRGFNPSNESRVDANGADFDYDKMVADAQKREADAWKTPAPKN